MPWLAGIMVVLAGFLAWDWHSQNAVPEGKPARGVADSGADRVRPVAGAAPMTPGSERAPPVRPLASLDLQRLHDTVKRPLFERRRRPVEPPPARVEPKSEPRAAAVEQRPEPDQNALTLLGVAKSEGRTIALLKRNQGGQNVRAEEGDVIDGWTIERIEAQSVVLRQGQRQISLQLFRKQAR